MNDGAMIETKGGHSGGVDRVVAQCSGVLKQCADLLEGVTQEEYTAPSERMFGATIGQHVRHTIDHFRAPLRTRDGDAIDYDRRDRGTSIETQRDAAIGEVRALLDELARTGGEDASRNVRIRVMLTSSGETTDLDSTLARELAFASHHAIHHHAMIAAIASERGIDLPDGFGKAPSTLEHERAGA